MDDNLKYHNMAALKNKENISLSSYYNIKTSMSVLGRVNYSYKRRYYATFTARADGASNFAAGKKWGFFISSQQTHYLFNFCQCVYIQEEAKPKSKKNMPTSTNRRKQFCLVE